MKGKIIYKSLFNIQWDDDNSPIRKKLIITRNKHNILRYYFFNNDGSNYEFLYRKYFFLFPDMVSEVTTTEKQFFDNLLTSLSNKIYTITIIN